jgi:Sec-independent protein secretion pathway component TatC
LLAVGLVFELPIFVLALVRLGITTAAKLRRNRRIG